MLLENCMVTLIDLSYILVYMRRVTQKMVMGRNTTLSALILCDLDCYSMQLLWYVPFSPFFFYRVKISNHL